MRRWFALVALGSLTLLAVAGSAGANPGDLDPGFASFAGRVITPVGSANDVANAVAVASSDGRFIAAGSTLNGSNTDFMLVKYRINGSPDTSFGTNGVVTTDFGSGHDSANAIVIKSSNGKIFVAGYAHNGTDVDFAVARYLSDGSPDPNFGTGGKVMTDFFGNVDVATGIVLQPDGKIVVGGYASNGSNFDFAIARYNGDGTLDTSFDGDGRQTVSFGSGDDKANALIRQSDGKLVLAGSVDNGSNLDFGLARIKTGGGIDTSFDGDGRVTTSFGSANDEANALVVLSGDKLVAAGYSHIGTNDDFALAKYTTTGAPDTSFNGTGKVTTNFVGSGDRANGLAVQSDNKLVAAGTAVIGGFEDFAAARYQTNGALDTSFDGDGKATTDFRGDDDAANALVRQSDGNLLAAGSIWNGSNYDVALARWTTTGALDPSFSSFLGRVYTDVTPGNDDSGSAVALQPDGKSVVAGYTDNGSNWDFAVARYNPKGLLSGTFGTGGIVTTDISGSGSNDLAFAVAIKASNGKIYVCGRTNSGLDDDFAIVRYNSNGTLDTGWGGGDGKLTTDFGLSNDDTCTGLALQSDGKLVAVGTTDNGVDDDFAIARYLSDGTLDTGFSGDGLKTVDFGFGDDQAAGVAIQSDGKIVVAGTADNGSDNDFALARLSAAGALDTGFSGDGRQMTDFGGGYDSANAVTLGPSNTIVAAGQSFNGSDFDFALARYTSGGGLDNTFSGNGKETTDFNGSNDYARSVLVQPDGKVVAAGYALNPPMVNDFAIARYSTAGVLDNTFSGDGRQYADFFNNSDEGYGLVRQADGKLLVAGFAYNGADYDFGLARFLP